MKKLLGFLAMAVLIFAVIWFALYQPATNSNLENGTQNQDETGKDADDDATPIVGNVWFGELRTSDNASKGNLMLLLSDGSNKIVYITTSRDYATLIGKRVAATVNGTTAGFQLIDIQLDARGDIHFD